MLSPYCNNLLQELDIKLSSKGMEKLVPNLNDKTKYIVHCTNLKLYQALWGKVGKTHRILQFTQMPWLAPYITFNMEQRKLASTDFAKNFFKLMNNRIYGKTMENLRKRRNIVLTQSEKTKIKLVASPSFHTLYFIGFP